MDLSLTLTLSYILALCGADHAAAAAGAGSRIVSFQTLTELIALFGKSFSIAKSYFPCTLELNYK
jgi:hypothetical protein